MAGRGRWAYWPKRTPDSELVAGWIESPSEAAGSAVLHVSNLRASPVVVFAAVDGGVELVSEVPAGVSDWQMDVPHDGSAAVVVLSDDRDEPLTSWTADSNRPPHTVVAAGSLET